MKTTADLIEQLAKRGPQSASNTRLAFALPLTSAAMANFAALLILLGMPFAYGLGPVLGKWAFSLPLTVGAIASLYALAHPGRRSSLLLALTLAPLLGVAGVAMLESTGGSGKFPATTWLRSVLAMLLLGMLGFVAAIYVTRLFAPVRLRHAGMASGLVGGGIAASTYAPFGQEPTAVYLLVFLGAPIITLALFGWLAGPRLLRW